MTLHEDEAPKLSARMWRHRARTSLHALGHHAAEEIEGGSMDRELDRAETNAGESMRSRPHHTKPPLS